MSAIRMADVTKNATESIWKLGTDT